ncbi:MAG: hypothetical protein ACI4VQ_05175, partial [Clostridia bacterium]
YDPKLSGIKYGPKTKYQPGKIQALKFKQCFYKLRNLGGKSDTGIVNLNFLSSSFSQNKPVKEYNFDKYNLSTGITHSADNAEEEEKKKKINLKNYHFDDNVQNEIDPINTDTSDSGFLFDNEDAIIFNFKHGQDKK